MSDRCDHKEARTLGERPPGPGSQPYDPMKWWCPCCGALFERGAWQHPTNCEFIDVEGAWKRTLADRDARHGGKRAPVQANKLHNKPAGTIAWWEHLEAWKVYSKRYGENQSAERIAERSGFCYGELTDLLGHEPGTWEPKL